MSSRLELRFFAWVPALGLCGCETTGALTTPHQPGPNLGHAAGVMPRSQLVDTTTATPAPAPMPGPSIPSTPGNRMMREWKYEMTPDGRTIRVAYETEVDAEGRPVGPTHPVKY